MSDAVVAPQSRTMRAQSYPYQAPSSPHSLHPPPPRSSSLSDPIVVHHVESHARSTRAPRPARSSLTHTVLPVGEVSVAPPAAFARTVDPSTPLGHKTTPTTTTTTITTTTATNATRNGALRPSHAPFGSTTSLVGEHTTTTVAAGSSNAVWCDLDCPPRSGCRNPLCIASVTRRPPLMLQENGDGEEVELSTIVVPRPLSLTRAGRPASNAAYSPSHSDYVGSPCGDVHKDHDSRVKNEGSTVLFEETDKHEESAASRWRESHEPTTRSSSAKSLGGSWPALPSDEMGHVTKSSKWWANVICLSKRNRPPEPFLSTYGTENAVHSTK